MHSHINIKAGGKSLTLPEDFSLDLEFKNPMFNDVEAFSYPVQIPLDGNRHLVKNIEDRKSAMRPVSIEHEDAEIWAEGFQIFKGEIATSADEEVDGSVSFNVDGSKTLKSLIADLDCKDVPVKDDICIGEKVNCVSVEASGWSRYDVEIPSSHLVVKDTSDNVVVEVEEGTRIMFYLNEGTHNIKANVFPQSLGFSVPYLCNKNDITATDIQAGSQISTDVDGYIRNVPKRDANFVSFINVTDAYPTAKYCNARVAYKNYAMKSATETDKDRVVSGSPYKVLDADRPQSGVCFYVLYFLDCLFGHLGLEWDNTELLKIEDLKRLCFYTTKCSYDEVVSGTKTFSTLENANKWMECRGTGAEFEIQYEKDTQVSIGSANAGMSIGYHNDDVDRVDWDSCVLREDVSLFVDSEGEAVQSMRVSLKGFKTYGTRILHGQKSIPDGDYVFEIKKVNDINVVWRNVAVTSNKVTSKFSRMYANSGNFPDATVDAILTSLENQFGIRFIYDAEGKKVTARLLRDMYRSTAEPHTFLGKVDTMNKIAEKITGVRCCYSDESGSKEQKNNLRDKTRDYDTDYDYIDYPDPEKKGQSGTSVARFTDIDHTFADIVNNASNADNTCYIDQRTGNAYRVKIDSEATSTNTMKPRWFEVGQYKGVEFGDCSADNEDFVTEIASSFQPLKLSDVAYPTSVVSHQPNLVAFCDEDMEHEYIKQYLDYPFESVTGEIYLRAVLRLEEAYDVSSSDDGNSPLQSYDWGNAIAIMRGGGTNATTQTYESGYDGFGNSKWRQVAGKYALTTDSVDMYGNRYDYNGDTPGVLAGERFSLKPRAYKGWLCPWATGKLCDADILNDGEANNGNKKWFYHIANRGWVDRFLFEHANFLLDRRKFKVKAECSAAVLADIKNHWSDRWSIDGEVGYIDKVSASISARDGIGQVEITFYAI